MGRRRTSVLQQHPGFNGTLQTVSAGHQRMLPANMQHEKFSPQGSLRVGSGAHLLIGSTCSTCSAYTLGSFMSLMCLQTAHAYTSHDHMLFAHEPTTVVSISRSKPIRFFKTVLPLSKLSMGRHPVMTRVAQRNTGGL